MSAERRVVLIEIAIPPGLVAGWRASQPLEEFVYDLAEKRMLTEVRCSRDYYGPGICRIVRSGQGIVFEVEPSDVRLGYALRTGNCLEIIGDPSLWPELMEDFLDAAELD